MTTPNSQYIPAFTIQEIILDKDDGEPLANGVVKFFRDTQRTVPKPVYQLTGNALNYGFQSLGVEIQLGIDGSFTDSNGNPVVPYFYPFDSEGDDERYYVVVESSNGVTQFTREAVPAAAGQGPLPPELRTNTENELINPQFVDVLFNNNKTKTISVSGANNVVDIAPGWAILSSGSGDIELEQITNIPQGAATSPSYALRINADSSIGSDITLRQRLTETPKLLSDQYASGTVTASSNEDTTLTMRYEFSDASATDHEIFASAITGDGSFQTVSGVTEIGGTLSTDDAPDGYIDIKLIIPTNRDVTITSVQVVGVNNQEQIPYDQQTVDRQRTLLSNYYRDSMWILPKTDLLAGWTFGQNPWQFSSTSIQDVSTVGYLGPDQTFFVQKQYVQTAQQNNIRRARASAAEHHGLEITANTNDNQFALIQYIDPKTIMPYWDSPMSVKVNARLFSPSHDSTVTLKCWLIVKSGLPSSSAQNYPISNWSGDEPSFDNDFTVIKPQLDPEYTLQKSYADTYGDNYFPSYEFNNFQLPSASSNNETLAIVVFTTSDMNPNATADRIVFDKINLVPNEFAIDAYPITFDEMVGRCQYYWEQSYPFGSPGGTTTTDNILEAYQPATLTEVRAATVRQDYQVRKRTNNPNVTIYNPSTGSSNNFRWIHEIATGQRDAGNATFSNFFNLNTHERNFVCFAKGSQNYNNVTSQGSDPTGVIELHYTIDARIGV